MSTKTKSLLLIFLVLLLDQILKIFIKTHFMIGEEIVIDGHIIVTVVAIKGGIVRLEITAPPSVCVDRGEVHQRRAECHIVEGNSDPLRELPLLCDAVGGFGVPRG